MTAQTSFGGVGANAPDPLRAALTELLKPVQVDDEAILNRVRYLLLCEKALGTWREKGLPF